MLFVISLGHRWSSFYELGIHVAYSPPEGSFNLFGNRIPTPLLFDLLVWLALLVIAPLVLRAIDRRLLKIYFATATLILASFAVLHLSSRSGISSDTQAFSSIIAAIIPVAVGMYFAFREFQVTQSDAKIAAVSQILNETLGLWREIEDAQARFRAIGWGALSANYFRFKYPSRVEELEEAWRKIEGFAKRNLAKSNQLRIANGKSQPAERSLINTTSIEGVSDFPANIEQLEALALKLACSDRLEKILSIRSLARMRSWQLALLSLSDFFEFREYTITVLDRAKNVLASLDASGVSSEQTSSWRAEYEILMWQYFEYLHELSTLKGPLALSNMLVALIDSDSSSSEIFDKVVSPIYVQLASLHSDADGQPGIGVRKNRGVSVSKDIEWRGMNCKR
jgi:hypothetical protein